MWKDEILVAIDSRQSITIQLSDGEVLQGVPESCSDRVKLRNDEGVVFVPIEDIEHVSRFNKFYH